jgi:hypothetical protein
MQDEQIPEFLPDEDTDLEHAARLAAAVNQATLSATHSRAPFLAGLTAIVLATALGSTWITRTTFARRLADAQASGRTSRAPDASRRKPGPQMTPQMSEVTITRAPQRVDEPAGAAQAPTAAERAEASPKHNAAADDDRKPKRLSPREEPKTPREERAPRDEPKAPRDEPKGPPASTATLKFTTTPSVKVLRGDKAVSTLRLSAPSGEVTVGGGTDAATDPFTVKLSYRVEGESVTYIIESEPWAIVTRSGVGMGRVPVTSKETSGSTTFELAHPKEGRRLKLTVRFAP